MSEEDLQLLITLDDPGEPEEDIFNHLHAKNNLEYWLDRQFSTSKHRAAVSDTDNSRTSGGSR